MYVLVLFPLKTLYATKYTKTGNRLQKKTRTPVSIFGEKHENVYVNIIIMIPLID